MKKLRFFIAALLVLFVSSAIHGQAWDQSLGIFRAYRNTYTNLYVDSLFSYTGDTIYVASPLIFEETVIMRQEVSETFRIENRLDDATPSELVFWKRSATPADADSLGRIEFNGANASLTQLPYAQIIGISEEVADADIAGRVAVLIRHDDGTPALDNFLDILGDNGTPGQGLIEFNASQKDVDLEVNALGISVFTIDGALSSISGVTNKSASEVITFTNTQGTGASAIGLTATAGGITAKVADEKELKLGNVALDAYFIVAASATAGSEDVRVVNTNGTDNGAIEITSSAGGIDVNAKEMLTLDVAGGTAATADIIITNTPGTDEAAIAIQAVAGGVDVDAAAAKDVNIAGGQVIVSSKDNVASAISLTTNIGGTETIVLTNTQGTAEGAIELTSTAGGVDINVATGKNIDMLGGQLIFLSNENVASAVSFTTNTGVAETMVFTNTLGTDPAAIQLVSSAGGITLTAGMVYVSSDLDVVDNVTAGDIIIDEASGVLNFSGTTLATLSATADIEITTTANNEDIKLIPHGTGDVIVSSAGLVLSATENLYFDGEGDTYIEESGADILDIYVGGLNILKLTEGATDIFQVTANDLYLSGEATDLFLDQGSAGAEDHDINVYFGDDGTDDAHYLRWDDGDSEFKLSDGITVGGPMSMGDITVSSSIPSVNLKDTDAAAGDVNAVLYGQATNTGDGTENIDVLMRQQVAGAMTTFFHADADGAVEIGTATQNTTVAGDLTITGDDLFMATNTANYVLRADGTNYNPTKFDDSADLAGFLDDETGTGVAVFGTSPTLTTSIQVASGFSIDITGTGNSYVEVIQDNNAGVLAVGRTTATEPSMVSITDGGADNEPGMLSLYDDEGTGHWIWMSTANELRGAITPITDDDADGYVVIDLDDGTIGAATQNILANDITASGLIKRSVAAGITATNPGVQGNNALTEEINEISTVGADDDAVTLPAANAGLVIVIINNGANQLEIWPASGDNAGNGVDTAVFLTAGSNATFVAYNTTNWESVPGIIAP